MSFDEAVLRCLVRYAVFQGRARPGEFWWFLALFATVLAITVAILIVAPKGVGIMLVLIAILSPPMVAVTVRRLHDVGATGWILVFLLPVIGQIVLIAWLTRASIPRRNRFGPEPGKNVDRYLLYAR